MYYGIKDGKVWDVCSDERNKRTKDNGVPTLAEFYLELNDVSYRTGDSYNDVSKEITKDSPQRFATPEKSQLELRVQALEIENGDLKNRLSSLESK